MFFRFFKFMNTNSQLPVREKRESDAKSAKNTKDSFGFSFALFA